MDKKIILEKDVLETINEFDEEDRFFVKCLNLISMKPLLYICNVDESSIITGNKFSKEVEQIAVEEENGTVNVSAVIESQISEFENKEEKLLMLKDLGLQQTTLNKVINAGYNLLNLITFFTSGPKETRAWTIIKNTKVAKAAGKIHSDFEKGFIRAETISYNDFIDFKGELACRELGKLRQEGKDYIVKDGEIFHFLFKV